jgi:hypothetical protein
MRGEQLDRMSSPPQRGWPVAPWLITTVIRAIPRKRGDDPGQAGPLGTLRLVVANRRPGRSYRVEPLTASSILVSIKS